jgi:hypothetical protein
MVLRSVKAPYIALRTVAAVFVQADMPVFSIFFVQRFISYTEHQFPDSVILFGK